VVIRPGGGGAIGHIACGGARTRWFSLVWNPIPLSTTIHMGPCLQLDYQALRVSRRWLVDARRAAVRGDAKWRRSASRAWWPRASAAGGPSRSGTPAGQHTHIHPVALFSSAGAHVGEVPFGARRGVITGCSRKVDAV